MARDSLFGERIVWQGRCREVSVPFTQKVTAVVAAVVSAVTLCYAVVIAESLDMPVGGMVLFAGWCATLSPWQTHQVPIPIRMSLKLRLENDCLDRATEKPGLARKYNIRLIKLYTSL